MKKYLYKGQLFSAEQIAQAANKRGMDFGAYISQFGITEQSDAPTVQPQEVKKKEQPSPALNNGGAVSSPLQSNSISPFNLAEGIIQNNNANSNDAIIQNKRANNKVVAGKEEVKKQIATDNFNRVVNPSFPQSNEQVSLTDGTKIDVSKITPIGGSLDNRNNSFKASVLQSKILKGNLDDNDVAELASGAGVIPELIKAKIKNDDLDIAVATFKNEKNNFDNSIKESIIKTNERFGLADTYEGITSTPEATREYVNKVEKLKQVENEKLSAEKSMRSLQGTASNLSPGATTANLTTFYDDIEKEESNLNDIVGNNSYLVKNKAIEKIVADETLTRDQKIQKTLDVINGREYNNAKDALANEKQPSFLDKVIKYSTGLGLIRTATEDTDYDRKENKDALKSYTGVARLALSNKTNERLQQDKLQLAQDKRTLAEKTAAQTDGTVFVQEELNIQEREKKLTAIAGEIESTDAIFNEFPSLKKQQVTSLINDYKAQVSGNLDEENSIPKEEQERLKAAGLNNYLKENGIDLNNEVVQDAIDEDRTKSYSLFGGSGKAFADVFRSTRKSIGDLTGARDDISLLGEKRLDELFPTTISKTDKFQLDGVTKLSQNVGQTTGQVLGQAVLQYSTAGLGRLAGAAKAASTIGSWTSGALTSYDDAYKEAYDFTDSQLGRSTYAGLIAVANAASEKIFNDAKLIEAIPGVKQAYSEIARKFGTKGFTDAMANEILKKTQKTIVDYGKSYVQNVGQEVVEEGTVTLFTDATKYLYGDKTVTINNSLQNLKETAIQTATGMLLVGAGGAYADVKKRRNVSEAGTLYNAAIYKDEATAAIEKGFADGIYGEQEKNTKLQILNTAASKLQETKAAETVLGREFSRGEKQLFVANLTAESVLKEQQKNTTSDDVKEAIQVKLDNLKAQQQQIFKGGVTVSEDGSIETNTPTVPVSVETPTEAAPIITPYELAKEDIALVEKVKAEKKLGVFANMPPLDLFQMIAQQAQDLDNNGNIQESENAEQMRGMAMKSTVNQFGQELVDRAIELFPAPKSENVSREENTTPQQEAFVPTPLKTELTDTEKADIKKGIPKTELLSFAKARKEGNEDAFLLNIANDKINQQNQVAKQEYDSKNSQADIKANEPITTAEVSNAKEGNGSVIQPTEVQNNGQQETTTVEATQPIELKPYLTGNAATQFIAKETQFEALDRLTKGIEELPAKEQKAEIEKRAAAHELSYKEFSKGENKISDENSKAQRVSDFANMTAKAMAKFLTPKGKAEFAADKGAFENGSRIDEYGKVITENDFVTLKEKVKQLRKEGNDDEIKKLNTSPAKYLSQLNTQTNEKRNDDAQAKTEAKGQEVNKTGATENKVAPISKPLIKNKKNESTVTNIQQKQTTKGNTTTESTDSSSSDTEKKKKPVGNRVPKGKRKIKSPLYLKALSLENPTIQQQVMQYFVGGGQINTQVLQQIFGGGREGNRKSIKGEVEARLVLINNTTGAKTVDDLAQKMWEGQIQVDQYDTQEFRDAIESVIISFDSKNDMAKSLADAVDELTDATEQEQQAEYEAYQKEAGEFTDDAIDVIDNLSDEEINNIDEDWTPMDDDFVPFQKGNKRFTTITSEAYTALLGQLKKAFPKVVVQFFNDSNVGDILKGNSLNEYNFQVDDIYHGSPYSFDKFSTSKMGTGEGQQAFGWGLYFTDVKSIAENYGRVLSRKEEGEVISKTPLENLGLKENEIDDLKYSVFKIDNFAEARPQSFYIEYATNLRDSYKRGFEENKEGTFYKQQYETYNKLVPLLESGELTVKPRKAKLYKVSLHEGKTPSQYDWLVWDKKPNKEQVQKLFSKLTTEQIDKGFYYGIKPDATNADLYKGISKALGSDKEASSFLLKEGIDGIKYPAESIARGTTSDNARGFNYVVFDENAITVKEKIQFLKTKNGTVYGFVKEGNIYLNENEINSNTPVHEYGHIWQQMLPNTFKEGIALLKASKAGRALIEKIKANPAYANNSQAEIEAEALVTAMGDKGESIFNNAPTTLAKFKQWLNDFFRRLGAKLGIAKLSPDYKFDKFVRDAVGDILSGKEIVQEAIPSNNKVNLSSEQNNKLPLQKITQYAKQVIEGGRVFKRFSQAEQQGFARGGKIHAESSIILATEESTSSTSNKSVEEQEATIEAYAKEKGIWVDDVNNTFDKKYGDRLGSGEEAIVWDNGKDVVKSQNTLMYANLQEKLDGITLMNTQFPEAAIEVIGFGRNEDGEFQVLVKQPFIEAAPNKKITKQELDNYLEKIGYTYDNENNHSHPQTLIEDLHTGNAILTPKGNIVVIDPIMRLNTKEQGYGGKRILEDTIFEDTPQFQYEPNELKDLVKELRDLGNTDAEIKSLLLEVDNSEASIDEALGNSTQANAPTTAPVKPANGINGKTGLKQNDYDAITEILDKEFSAEQYPTLLKDNETITRLAVKTQERDQDRTIAFEDTQVVTAQLKDLRTASLGNAQILKEGLGKDWKQKLITFFDKEPAYGYAVQKIGLLNIISKELNDEIKSATSSSKVDELKAFQRKVDIISLDVARQTSLALRSRQLYKVYSDFAKDKPIAEILSEFILNDEQRDTKAAVQEALGKEYTDEELNVTPRKKRSKNTKASPLKRVTAKKTTIAKDVKDSIVLQGVNASEQIDADGNKIKMSFSDLMKAAKDAITNFKC